MADVFDTQGMVKDMAQFNPVTKGLDMAQGGGQQLLNMLMQLFAQQQQPQAPLPMTGPQENQRDLRSRMIAIPPGGSY